MRSEVYSSWFVCMYVCMCSNLPTHTLESQERDIILYQRIYCNTGTISNFADFPKNASFKSYGVICSSQAALAS